MRRDESGPSESGRVGLGPLRLRSAVYCIWRKKNPYSLVIQHSIKTHFLVLHAAPVSLSPPSSPRTLKPFQNQSSLQAKGRRKSKNGTRASRAPIHPPPSKRVEQRELSLPCVIRERGKEMKNKKDCEWGEIAVIFCEKKPERVQSPALIPRSV